MTVLLVAVRGIVGLSAADWPQFLGPNRNGTTSEIVGSSWPAEGPTRRWRLDAGEGFAGPVVSGSRVFLFERQGGDDVLTAVEAGSGRNLWAQRQPTAFVDTMGSGDGPRSTPCVAGDRVVTFGADGRLSCFAVADGRRLWTVEARREWDADPGFFGFACSPLVVGRLVMLNLGGRRGAGLAAFELETGKPAWKCTDSEAGYASPVPVPGGDADLVWFFHRDGLAGVAQPSGEVRFQFPWRSRMSASVNAASPVVTTNEVFVTSSYGTGAVLLRRRGGDWTTVWSGDDSLSAHFATPVLHAGHLYGFHGRQERGAELRCVEWATGRVRWRHEAPGGGTLALAGDRLVVLFESGELLVAPAVPDGFRPAARAQVLGRVARAPFAIAEGALFARDSRHWVCLQLGAATPR